MCILQIIDGLQQKQRAELERLQRAYNVAVLQRERQRGEIEMQLTKRHIADREQLVQRQQGELKELQKQVCV